MSAHGNLTEDSLRTHPRKGREGKGVGRENCSGLSPHPSSLSEGQTPTMDDRCAELAA